MTIIDIKTELQSRADELTKIITECNSRLRGAPEARLTVYKLRGKDRYFKEVGSDRKRTYLNADSQEIKSLEETNYYKHLLKATEGQLNNIQKALKSLEGSIDPERVFLGMPRNKTHLITPYRLTEATTAKKIASFSRKPKQTMVPTDSPYVTKAKEKVRSKSELIIANALFDKDIPYLYEANFAMGEFYILNPDFTVLNKRNGKVYIWEHLGRMDDPKYCTDSQLKIEHYAECGYFPGKNLLITFESSGRPLSTVLIEQIIEEYLV